MHPRFASHARSAAVRGTLARALELNPGYATARQWHSWVRLVIPLLLQGQTLGIWLIGQKY